MRDVRKEAYINRNEMIEIEHHRFSAEASDIGFPVGTWPEHVKTNAGNGMPFIRVGKKVDADGDILSVRYVQANGCITLHVHND